MTYHLFPDEKYVDDFISKVLECSTQPENNVFLLRAQRPFARVNRHAERVIEAPLYSQVLEGYINGLTASDRLLIHYLERRVCEWLDTVKVAAPIGWVFWGAELYNNAGINFPLYGPLTREIYRSNLLQKPWLYRIPFFRKIEIFYENQIKAPRMYRLKARTFGRLSYFYNYNPYNYKVFRRAFRTPAEFVYFIYPRIFDVPDFDEDAAPPLPIDEQKVNVIIGNSANYSNNHLEAFDKIRPHESVVVWVPLSYGDKDYAEYLQRIGNKRFGDNFRPLTEYYPTNQYFAFLQRMDIGVFGNYRPLAMGNITTLLAQGKPMVMMENNPSFKDLEDRGFFLTPFRQLSTDLLLRAKSDYPITSNVSLAREHFYGDQVSEIYQKLF